MAEPSQTAPQGETVRVAVLGGGVAALTAALRLTEKPEDRARHAVTVYQMGWRLGGKCASGRDLSQKPAARVLEHGLHIFAGFYHNAFNLLKGCYSEVGVAGGLPTDDAFKAFLPKNTVALMETVNGKQVPWPLDFLALPGLPGEGDAVPSIEELVAEVVRALLGHFLGGHGGPAGLAARAPEGAAANLPAPLAARVSEAMSRAAPDVTDRLIERGAAHPPGDSAEQYGLHHAALVAHAGSGAGKPGAHLPHVLQLLEGFARHIESEAMQASPLDWLRRLKLGTNLGWSVIAGIHGEDVASKGFDHLDGEELKDWLMRWGAWRETVDWAPVNAGYDYAFALGGGDPDKPTLGAGTGLRGFMRLLFAYKGALFWEMIGSMGEVVVLPMYLALLARGVEFKFFNRVDQLHLDAGGTLIDTIALTQQATPTGSYDPLMSFGDRHAWPAMPNWDQLENGAALAASGIDLESPSAQPPGAVPVTLRRGVDFDMAVLGISVGALSALTPELGKANPAWAQMAEGIVTTPTIALQLWTVPDVKALGSTLSDRVITGSDQPLSSWSDMSFLIETEGWSPENRPGAILYFCGQLPPSADKAADPTKAARDLSIAWLKRNVPDTFSNAADAKGSLGIDPADLFVVDGAEGDARFATQYWRANVHPSDRYVQSAPGTTALRLASDASGFANLYLAGDWTLNGLNAGCVEAAVMSGLHCAKAILGDPEPVPGARDI